MKRMQISLEKIYIQLNQLWSQSNPRTNCYQRQVFGRKYPYLGETLQIIKPALLKEVKWLGLKVQIKKTHMYHNLKWNMFRT